jgi:hypothetical protein
VVKTSFSSASLHIGSRRPKQKARLHIVHDAAGARTSILAPDSLEDAAWDCRGIIVLFVKQVHLQKDGDARNVSYLV